MSPSALEIVAYLDELLGSDRFSDSGTNGLQVPNSGRPVEVIATGVSVHAGFLEQAAGRGAGVALVHHGMFWSGQPLRVGPSHYRYLRILLHADMALAAYHLPLDAHPEYGNNALLAHHLRMTGLTPFAPHNGHPIGIRGRFAGRGIPLAALKDRVEAICGQQALVLACGPDPIRTLGIVSGAATDHAHDAIALGLDAFLTGEPAERAFGIANDNSLTFLAAGHHATETLGVNKLGELVAGRFGIQHHFIDVRNPI